jgi:hypothetical protein
MRYYEKPPEERKKLISSEKASSWKYVVIRLSYYLGIIGVLFFFLAFFFQDSLDAAGYPYRRVELYGVTIVFLAWMCFLIFCRMLSINTSGLTYPKLMSIFRNQVIEEFDEFQYLRKQVAASLGFLDDTWALYPDIFADDPRKHIQMVVVGPGGVFGLAVINKDPKKKEFVDPTATLILGCEELAKKLKTPIQPILVFMRKKKVYENPLPELKIFTLHEMVAYLDSRERVLEAVELKTLEGELKFVANLGSGIIHIPSKFTNTKGS